MIRKTAQGWVGELDGKCVAGPHWDRNAVNAELQAERLLRQKAVREAAKPKPKPKPTAKRKAKKPAAPKDD